MKRFKAHLKVEPAILDLVNGETLQIEIRELTGIQRDQYLDLTTRRVIKGEDGKMKGLTTFVGTQTDLLVRACYKSGTEDNLEPAFIDSLPISVRMELFDMAQEISNLGGNKEAVEQAKND